jgi:hypothetical protein
MSDTSKLAVNDGDAAKTTVKPNRRMLSAICRPLLPGMGAGIASAARPVGEGWCERAACAIALFTLCSDQLIRIILPNEPVMADQIVITEKSSQAKDVRVAVGSRYGEILAAEGHLFDLLEPEDVVPA